MKDFEYVLPSSLREALELLPRERDAAATRRVLVMAGGQDLLTEMKDHLVAPEQVVDLKRLPELDGLAFDADGVLALGATVTLARVEEHAELGRRLPLLREAAGAVASEQIRSVGTVGGNLCQRPRCWYYRNEQVLCLKKGGVECYAYGGLNKYNAILGGGPSYIVHPSDLAPALVALDAEARIAGRGGERSVPLERFFTLPTEGSVLKENVLAADEVLLGVRVPPLAGEGWRSTYLKFRERGSYDFALAAVALALRMEGDTVREARLCLGGVAPIPWRAKEAEALLAGRAIDEGTCKAVGEAALRGARPLEHNAYKVPLTKGLITRALQQLAKG